MNLLKVVAVICLAVFSANVLSNDDSNKEPELTPPEILDDGSLATQKITDPVQVKEEAYQRILNTLKQRQEQNPTNENPTIEVVIYPESSMDSTEAYNFLTDIIRDMPEGSINSFEYFWDLSRATATVNRIGVDYLYLLGVVSLEQTIIYHFD